MSLWQTCEGERFTGPLKGTLFRLVESQEHVATLSYVDTLEEQAMLERLLDEAKPPYADDSDALHYLLKTPFRYPPLKWGSRFGRTHEPSLFYGGANATVALAESAYYRLVFWHSMDAPPPAERMRTQHTLFSARYATEQGQRLHEPPYHDHQTTLTDPREYRACQALGSAMREAGIEAFQYRSARDPAQGLCVALYSPRALVDRSPRDMTQWLCETGASDVAFKQVGARQVHSFALGHFLVEGVLPLPA